MIEGIASAGVAQRRNHSMEEAEQKLKRARERLNLRYRDVEEASNQIAARHNNDEYVIALSRLSDIENKGTVPTIYRLYALCERKKRANEAMAYNGLVQSWPEITRLAREGKPQTQTQLFDQE